MNLDNNIGRVQNTPAERTLSPTLQRLLLGLLLVLLLGVYAIAWHAPSFGLYHDDGVYLNTAKSLVAGHGYIVESLPTPIPMVKYPPLWPALLALFLLVSENIQWLKLLPLLCTAGWLLVTAKLLVRLGASRFSALLLVAMAAASPTVVFLSTNLLSEPLCALLIAAALLALTDDHGLPAGVFTALAVLTRPAASPLAPACFLVLLVRGRLRGAAWFAIAVTLLVGPWLAWSATHDLHHPYYGNADRAATNILTGLAANEKFVVLGRNILFLLAGPMSVLTGFSNLYLALGTGAAMLWALLKSRRFVPDLFLLFYGLLLLVWIWPPDRYVTPVLPLILWVLWRGFRNPRMPELLAAVVLVLIGLSLYTDIRRIPVALETGEFPTSPVMPNDWAESQKLFAFIRERTTPDAVLMTNLDPLFYHETGRKAIRGYSPDGYKIFYAPPNSVITPDELSHEIEANAVTFVALTPDRDFGETRFYHSAVEALERGGVLEPVPVPGLKPGYRLLSVGPSALSESSSSLR